jgi:predicted nucleic acid-binding protein
VTDTLVDTSVWSIALRHRTATQISPVVQEFEELIHEMRVRMIGPIRQEVLSGIRDSKQFSLLKTRLRAFPDLSIHEQDFERAAEIFNACRSAGIQGSNIDFLMCAVAESNGLSIFTTDRDFERYGRYAKFSLHVPR